MLLPGVMTLQGCGPSLKDILGSVQADEQLKELIFYKKTSYRLQNFLYRMFHKEAVFSVETLKSSHRNGRERCKR